MNKTKLPFGIHSKILGALCDPFLNLAEHCEQTSRKAARRISILKALSGTSPKELYGYFKVLLRPILDYASPAWSHSASKTSLNKLRTVLNSALRMITGCSKISAIEHLHSECELLNVDNHHYLLASFSIITIPNPQGTSALRCSTYTPLKLRLSFPKLILYAFQKF